MTAHAPACSAMRACSALTTSMITPPAVRRPRRGRASGRISARSLPARFRWGARPRTLEHLGEAGLELEGGDLVGGAVDGGGRRRVRGEVGGHGCGGARARARRQRRRAAAGGRADGRPATGGREGESAPRGRGMTSTVHVGLLAGHSVSRGICWRGIWGTFFENILWRVSRGGAVTWTAPRSRAVFSPLHTLAASTHLHGQAARREAGRPHASRGEAWKRRGPRVVARGKQKPRACAPRPTADVCGAVSVAPERPRAPHGRALEA